MQNMPHSDTMSPVKLWNARRIYLTEQIASYANDLQKYEEHFDVKTRDYDSDSSGASSRKKQFSPPYDDISRYLYKLKQSVKENEPQFNALFTQFEGENWWGRLLGLTKMLRFLQAEINEIPAHKDTATQQREKNQREWACEGLDIQIQHEQDRWLKMKHTFEIQQQWLEMWRDKEERKKAQKTNDPERETESEMETDTESEMDTETETAFDGLHDSMPALSRKLNLYL